MIWLFCIFHFFFYVSFLLIIRSTFEIFYLWTRSDADLKLFFSNQKVLLIIWEAYSKIQLRFSVNGNLSRSHYSVTNAKILLDNFHFIFSSVGWKPELFLLLKELFWDESIDNNKNDEYSWIHFQDHQSGVYEGNIQKDKNKWSSK